LGDRNGGLLLNSVGVEKALVAKLDGPQRRRAGQ